MEKNEDMSEEEYSDVRDKWITDNPNDCDKKTEFDKWIDSVPVSGGGE